MAGRASGDKAKRRVAVPRLIGWFCLDATKRGNRRWCQMSECGQAERPRGGRRRVLDSDEQPLDHA